MKAITFSLFAILLAFTIVAHASDETPELCRKLSKVTDFYRCESPEVVCYSNEKTQQCWPKPAAQPKAAQTEEHPQTDHSAKSKKK